MASIKAWTNGAVGEPTFPAEFEVVKKAVLQVTDIKTNRNKYYAIELHKAEEGGSVRYRVFTHYGRTDDLETNPDAGQKECRYFDGTVSGADAAGGGGLLRLDLPPEDLGGEGLQGGGPGVEQDRLAEGAGHRCR